MGSLPLRERTLSGYKALDNVTVTDAPASSRAISPIVLDYMGHHPVSIMDNTHGQVTISPPG